MHSLTCSRLIGDEAYIYKANIFYNPVRGSKKKPEKKTAKKTINPPLTNSPYAPLKLCIHCEHQVSSECKCKFCPGALHVFCSTDIEPNNFFELEDRMEICCPKCAESKMPAHQVDYNQCYNNMYKLKRNQVKRKVQKRNLMIWKLERKQVKRKVLKRNQVMSNLVRLENN